MKSHDIDENALDMGANGEAPPVMTPDEADAQFRKDLLALIPFLRAFSRSLCGERELADDLAQEALAKAWQSRDTFRPGSNLKAWLFTILRNQFYSDRRRAWRQAPWDETAVERVPAAQGRADLGGSAFRHGPGAARACPPSSGKRSFWLAQGDFRTRMRPGSPIARSGRSRAASRARARR